MTPYRRDLERLRYWQGQTLRSRDGRAQSRFDAWRRQLHARALHPADGVSFGLTVSASAADPGIHDVACGVGHDCYGRELVLQRPRRVAAPAVPSWLMLRRRRAPAPTWAEPDGGLLTDEARLLDADVELVWSPVGEFEQVEGIALAKFTGGGLDLDFRRRQARPLARPRLARGETVRGNTPWEPWSVDVPDGQGGITKRVVGVETHIDTTAAGFTSTPNYVASLESPQWDIATAEFAPAFFPHVAHPSVDGFTFRLLMVETTRRRYGAVFGISRVVGTSRGVGDTLQIQVSDAGQFHKGDAIALLRPRTRAVVRVHSGADGDVTLAAALAEAEVDTTVLAAGNFPRMARVMGVGADSDAMVAIFTATPAVKKGDILLRTTDGETATIDSVSNVRGKITVNAPFPLWMATDSVSVARLNAAIAVTSATANGLTTSLLLPAGHQVNATFAIVMLNDKRVPLGKPRTVAVRVGDTIDVSPPLTATELAAADKVAVFAADIIISNVQSVGVVIEVDTTEPFAEGDFVTVSDDRTAIASIRRISVPKKELTLDARLPIKPGSSDLLAANWSGATTVAGFGPAGSNKVTVGRTDVARLGSFVVRRESDDSFSPPAFVTNVEVSTLTLAPPIAGLARLDTLAIGSFPRIVTVLSQHEQDEEIQVLPADAGLLAPGDEIAPLIAGADSAQVAQVSTVNGNAIVLGSSVGRLTIGQRLAVLHFSDRALLTKAHSPTSIEIDRKIEFRRGDVVGVLTHYADHSNPGWIERIDPGNRLVLASTGVEIGDGIVSAGWIDGGVVGPASVTYQPGDPALHWQFQPILRLVSADGLQQAQPAVAFGVDLRSGKFVSMTVVPYLYDALGHVYVVPTDVNARYRLRPETLSLITTFNTDFPRAFATFAQKQQLSVCWIGCQDEFPRAASCPAQRPHDVCAESDSSEV